MWIWEPFTPSKLTERYKGKISSQKEAGSRVRFQGCHLLARARTLPCSVMKHRGAAFVRGRSWQGPKALPGLFQEEWQSQEHWRICSPRAAHGIAQWSNSRFTRRAIPLGPWLLWKEIGALLVQYYFIWSTLSTTNPTKPNPLEQTMQCCFNRWLKTFPFS